VTGVTLDTGAVVALERRSARTLALLLAATQRRALITVPSAVVVEWWRGQRGPASRLLEDFEVEPLSLELARSAGAALGRCGRGPSPTDAIVMASAAQRGDLVLTGDMEDLSKLQTVFPAVRLLRV
jgi:predicted nucleic acid-binding protein